MNIGNLKLDNPYILAPVSYTHLGAWKALREAGVKIEAVAGTSVGALNGALICMGDLEKAEKIWREMTFSTVMDVDDEEMEGWFSGQTSVRDILKTLWEKVCLLYTSRCV